MSLDNRRPSRWLVDERTTSMVIFLMIEALAGPCGHLRRLGASAKISLAVDAAGNVVFDFEGSLNLARCLCSLADAVEEMLTSRSTMASSALTGWTGRFGTQFLERANDEQSIGTSLATALRADAQGWAFAWTQAMDEQNAVLYAREVNRVKNDRSNLEKLGGLLTGHDDLPPMPRLASVPQPPYFIATRSFARY